jgi:NTP pyrophosphatase (non-canonical NTP hydrolase)
MLRHFFPSTQAGASLYGCHFRNVNSVFKLYEMPEKSLEIVVSKANEFLIKNGYPAIVLSEFDEYYRYEHFPVSFYPHGYDESMVLMIKRDEQSESQVEFLTNELIKFRDDRDWEQFHNPKDLALALSIESNELLEQFLWKSYEEADKEKIKEELADVFSYGLLLAEKYNFKIEEILLEKIEKNTKKYPIEKSKGNAKKYDEL